MLKNYILLAFRNLRRKKSFTIINILGLSLGMATALSIAFYVSFELSFDDFQPRVNNIYRVVLERTAEGQTQEVTSLPAPVADELLKVSEVENVLRFVYIGYQNNSIIRTDDGERKTLQIDDIYYADSTIAEILHFPLTSGTTSAFASPHTLMLAESEAEKLFGSQDPVGESLVLSNNVGRQEYEVVAVFEDLPENTDFDYKVLLSMTTLPYTDNDDVLTSYDYWQSQTYALLGSSASPSYVIDHLNGIFESNDEVAWSTSFMPIRELHFQPYANSEQGNYQYVRALTLIGLIVLIIAWVNYINLSTSRAMERSKEVGVRKVMGSGKNQLTFQFIIESLVINLIAAFVAFTIVQLLRPLLQSIANPMILSPQQAPYFWLIMGGIILIGAVLAGSYPAFIMTSFSPTSILSGTFKQRLSGVLVRKGLVIFQFSISVFLLIGTLTVFQQIQYMRHSDLGMNIDNRLIVNSPPGSLNGDDPAFFESLDSFRKELAEQASVAAVTGASSIPGEVISWGNSNIKRQGEESNLIRMVSLIATDMNYFDVYEIDIIAGRGYVESDNTFRKGEIVINETAVGHFGFESPEAAIGEHLDGGEMFPELTIVGVTEDYHHYSLHSGYPTILYVLSAWSNYYTVHFNLPENVSPEQNSINLEQSIATVQKYWEKYFPEAPFDYFFADQVFDTQYRQDEEFGFLFGIFTSLAILLAILGLIGLVSYEVVQRTKEIGIRKVLGANTIDLVRLLTNKYLILVLIAGVIGLPAGYFIFEEWLQGFAFRITITPGLMLISIGMVISISLLVSVFQVIKTARNNPVQSIKYE